MDMLKAKTSLDKINRDFARMLRDPDNIIRIEQDILLTYVRDLYDALRAEIPAPQPPAMAHPTPVPPRPVAPALPPAPHTPSPIDQPPPRSVPPLAAPAPKNQPGSTPPYEQTQEVKDVERLFSFPKAKELSEKLAEQPIPDLRKAISLNDRLLYTRELFGSDQLAFDHSIQALNALVDFNQAKAFFVEHCVARYGWTDPRRFDLAKKFVNLARRRYL
jgi:hypothetical protein